MSDIFSRNTSALGGVFTADRAKLTFMGQLAVLVQNLNVSYAQTITRLYEVGGPNIYYVGGRTQGQMGLNRVVGPSGTVKAFYTQYGNVCNARNNPINLVMQETDCATNTPGVPINLDVKNAVITQVSFGVQAQDMIISESSAMIYSSLEMN